MICAGSEPASKDSFVAFIIRSARLLSQPAENQLHKLFFKPNH